MAAVMSMGALYVTFAPRMYTAKAQLESDLKRLQLSQSFGEAPIDPMAAETEIEILKSEKVLLPVIKDLRLIDNPLLQQGGFLSSLFPQQAPPPEDLRVQHTLEMLQSALSVSRVGRTQLFDISVKARDPVLAAQLVNAIAESFIHDQLDAKAETARRASVWLQERITQLGQQANDAERAVVEFKRAHDIVDTGGGRLIGDQQISEINIKLIAARNDVSQAMAKLKRIEDILASSRRTAAVDATVADTLSSPVVTKLRDKYLELGAKLADYSNRFGPNHLSVIRLRSQMQDIRNSITDELKRLAESYKSDLDIATRKEDDLKKSLDETVVKSQTTNQAQVKLRDLEGAAHSYRVLYDNFLQRHAEQVQQQSMGLSDTRLIAPAVPPHSPSQPKVFTSLAIATIGGLVLGLGIAGFREFGDKGFRKSDQVEKALSTSCIGLAPRIVSAETPVQSKSGVIQEFLKIIGLGSAGKDFATSPKPSTVESGFIPMSDGEGGKAPAPTAEQSEARATNEAATAEFRGEASAKAERVNELPQVESSSDKTSSNLISNKRGAATAVVDAQLSRFTEAMQAIKLAAELREPMKTSRVIGITSALPKEGKTTISINLARLIALTGAKTALVDCDLRICGLTRILAPEAKIGLREVVNQDLSFEKVMWKDELTNLEFLPAIAGGARAHPSEIFGLDATKALFEKLRSAFEWVIVDLPPAGLVIDTQSTAHLIDSYVFVVEWGKTSCSIVKRTLDSAEFVRDNLLGVVLNKVDMQQLHDYDAEYLTHAGHYYVEA
jgi:succinoglycan biosynthesis transport protein ExoP